MIVGDPYLHRVADTIDKHGYAVQFVTGDPDTGARPFAYTVGLHISPGHRYEIAVSGLDMQTSRNLLNALAVLASRGLTPANGLEISHDLPWEGMVLRLRGASRPRRLGVIHALYGQTPYVWQALWPDRHSRFPGDLLCCLPVEAQPML